MTEAKKSWEADGHPNLNDCSLDVFVNMVAMFPTGVQTLSMATVDYYGKILEGYPKQDDKAGERAKRAVA